MATATRMGAEEESGRGARAGRFAPRPWYTRLLPVLALVVALAAFLRFYRLSSPPVYVFDEVYYAKDACLDAGFPFRECTLKSPTPQTFWVHPPLGRWIIAAGEALFGNRPFGWRVAAAAFGTVSVLLTALLAFRLFASALWAGVAGLLLATESLHFVQSRIAMLDIFLATFVVAGFLLLTLDRRWMERKTRRWLQSREPEDEEGELLHLPSDRPPSPIFRPWRLAAGLAFGAAVASKWSGGAALLAAIALALAWERSRRKASGLDHPLAGAVREESFGIVLSLVIVPLAVYFASYVRWFMDNGVDLRGWWDVQRQMASYSINLDATHPYASKAWTWLLLKRPVAYYYDCARMRGPNCLAASEILGMGNPAIFWSSLLTLPYALLAWVAKRDWRAGLVLVAVAAQYLPWFFVGRTSFLFYMTPVTPFLVLAAVYALTSLAKAPLMLGKYPALAPLAALFVLVAVAMFVFFLPVLTGRTIPQSAWEARMWFRSWI